jgi:hypothetical protein
MMKKHLLPSIALLGALVAGNAFAEETLIYSWGPNEEGTIEEKGGTAETKNATSTEIGVSQAGYTTIRLTGKSDFSTTQYILITLDGNELAAGDIITVSGFRNKNETGKAVTPCFKFEGSDEVYYENYTYNNLNSAVADSDEYGTEPTTHTYTVPEYGAGATTIAISRKTTGTNFFISALTITGDRDPNAVKTAKTPSASLNNFNFETQGYTLSLSGSSASTIYYSIDGGAEAAYDAPIAVANGNNITFYAAEEGAENSETVTYACELPVFDAEKPYVAWIYDNGYNTYDPEKDPLAVAVSESYNVVPVAIYNTAAQYNAEANCPTLENANLWVITEAIGGKNASTISLKDAVGQLPIVCMKAFAYSTDRWNYGTPANVDKEVVAVTPAAENLKLFEGVEANEDGSVDLFTANKYAANHLQTVVLDGTEAPTDAETLATVDNAIAFHSSAKYVLLGISSDDIESANANAQKIVANAVTLLLNGEEANAKSEVVEPVEPEDPTAITNIAADNNAVHAIYDLRGNRVRTMSQSGLYVIDGQKVLVK